MDLHISDLTSTVTTAVVGAVVGLGQLLASKDSLSWRAVLGRALVSGGLGASASVILVWLPDTSLSAQFGLAAALATLGTDGLQALAQSHFGKSRGIR